jgi:hypothetical protein
MVTYVELDVKLLVLYREKRTAPDGTTDVTNIRKRRVTFRRLRTSWTTNQRRSKPLVSIIEIVRPIRLAKRQQKLSLDKVHQKVTAFYLFLRQSSRWALKQGAIGAFTSHDIFNMDKSRLSLFGDQTKLSINNINTCNEVEGCLSNKVSNTRTVLE